LIFHQTATSKIPYYKTEDISLKCVGVGFFNYRSTNSPSLHACTILLLVNHKIKIKHEKINRIKGLLDKKVQKVQNIHIL